MSEIKEENEKTKEEIKPKKEKKKLVLTKKQLFILALIAEANELCISSLFESYRRQYPDAYLVDVKSITIWLEKNGLIRHSGTFGSDFCYTETDKGVKYVSEAFKKNKK